MNIEEERKAFEKYVLSLKKYEKRSPKFIFDLDENGDYDNQDVYELHHAWQAAKDQAVPEGFVLVPKEPSAESVNHGHQVFLGHFNEGGQTGGRSLYFAYKAVLEAQEKNNEI